MRGAEGLGRNFIKTSISYTQGGGATPKGGAFFKLAVYKRVGKIAILVDKKGSQNQLQSERNGD